MIAQGSGISGVAEIRPSVPCHHIREYRYAYGAVEPITGESCFLIMPYCNTVCMNLFLSHLAKQYPDDIILLCCDGAAWHKSSTLCIPENIRLFFIPPYTPEMNPIEQIWKELRRRGDVICAEGANDHPRGLPAAQGPSFRANEKKQKDSQGTTFLENPPDYGGD